MLKRLLGLVGVGASLCAPAAPPAASPSPAALYESLWSLQVPAAAARAGIRGLVLEVEVGGGTDVLAVYADGRMRYLNHGGRAVVVDAALPALQPATDAVWRAVPAAAAASQPWVRDHRFGGRGSVRMVFIGGDGLRMAEGSFQQLQSDPRFGPLLLGGSELLAGLLASLR